MGTLFEVPGATVFLSAVSVMLLFQSHEVLMFTVMMY